MTLGDAVPTAEWRCNKCREIPGYFEQSLDLQMDHHESSATLEKAAAAGCYLCRTFRANFLYQHPELDSLPAGRCKVLCSIGDKSHIGYNLSSGDAIEFYIGDHLSIIQHAERFDSAWLRHGEYAEEGLPPSPKSTHAPNLSSTYAVR